MSRCAVDRPVETEIFGELLLVAFAGEAAVALLLRGRSTVEGQGTSALE